MRWCVLMRVRCHSCMRVWCRACIRIISIFFMRVSPCTPHGISSLGDIGWKVYIPRGFMKNILWSRIYVHFSHEHK